MAISGDGEIRASDINVELGRSITAQKSLDDSRRGEYVSINQANEDKPPANGQVAYSDWRNYDHDKVVLTAINISSTTGSKSQCIAKIVQTGYFDDGLSIGSAGFLDDQGDNPLTPGFYNTEFGIAIEIKDGKIIKLIRCR